VTRPESDRGHLLTEQAHPLSESLDELSTAEMVALFCQNDLEPQRAVAAAAPQLTAAVDAISDRLRHGGRLFYLGAGTSGRLGVLDAAECPPTFCTPPELVQGVLAGGAPALLRSSEGLEDRFEAGAADLEERGFTAADALVGIAAGGTTPYVLGGLGHARQLGALAIALACVAADQVPMPCDIDIRLLTGPELLTGSTRLKAGTATKMALNILSTGVMVRWQSHGGCGRDQRQIGGSGPAHPGGSRRRLPPGGRRPAGGCRWLGETCPVDDPHRPWGPAGQRTAGGSRCFTAGSIGERVMEIQQKLKRHAIDI